MNRCILKHFHSNLYLVVLGIYVKDETNPGKVSMARDRWELVPE